MIKPPVVKVLIFNPEGKLLILRRSKTHPHYPEHVDFPGGEVTQPKQSLGEFGFMSLCKDTEGNTFGLHSME